MKEGSNFTLGTEQQTGDEMNMKCYKEKMNAKTMYILSHIHLTDYCLIPS
jgi:hypothetical protein